VRRQQQFDRQVEQWAELLVVLLAGSLRPFRVQLRVRHRFAVRQAVTADERVLPGDPERAFAGKERRSSRGLGIDTEPSTTVGRRASRGSVAADNVAAALR
jgi:hypothetical protein